VCDTLEIVVCVSHANHSIVTGGGLYLTVGCASLGGVADIDSTAVHGARRYIPCL
jgi:hypothetical protein